MSESNFEYEYKRFRDFAETSADWLWEMDEDLRFTWFSDSVREVAGVEPEWHYGKTREDLLGDDPLRLRLLGI